MLKTLCRIRLSIPYMTNGSQFFFKTGWTESCLKTKFTKEIRFKLLAKYEDKRNAKARISNWCWCTSLAVAGKRMARVGSAIWYWPWLAKTSKRTLTEYRKFWRQKMDEINTCITARADQEELVDQPFIEKGQVRVSGPSQWKVSFRRGEYWQRWARRVPIGDALNNGNLRWWRRQCPNWGSEFRRLSDRMIRLLREDGVLFPNNKMIKFITLETLSDGSALHASGIWLTIKKSVK